MIRPRRFLSAALLGGLVALVGGLLAAAPASAHATLAQSSPADGATVTGPPDKVWLYFDQTVRVTNGSLRVLDDSGRRVDQANAREGDKGNQIVDDLRPFLPASTYTVVWRVTSADGHPVAGTSTFGVGVRPGAGRVVNTDGSAMVGVFDGLARFVFQIAAAGLVGVAFFVLVLWPPGADRPGIAMLPRGLWGAAFASAGALLLLEGAYGEGGRWVTRSMARWSVRASTPATGTWPKYGWSRCCSPRPCCGTSRAAGTAVGPRRGSSALPCSRVGRRSATRAPATTCGWRSR